MALTLTIGEKPVCHPADILEAARRNGTPTTFWGRANSYLCPVGPLPGVARLLMRRVDLDALDKNAFHSMIWLDGDRTLTVANLAIVRSESVNLSFESDEDAVHLVELQDTRRVLRYGAMDSQYNVRIPAPASVASPTIYYDDSLNASAVWTWQTMLDDIWGNLPTAAGTAPTLPYTPDGDPEGWRFVGVSAWDAVHDVLNKVNCTTSYDPVANTFGYVRLGQVQAGLAASMTGLVERLKWDSDYLQDYNLANVPATIRVFFHRRELYMGVEKDTPDASNWEMIPAVSKDHTTGVAGAITGSVLTVWDDLPAEYDTDGTNSNSADLQTRADEIGADIALRMTVTDERLHKAYAGLTTDILPGSEVSEVRWRDYGDGHGLTTEVIRAPMGHPVGTRGLRGANLHPVYPRLAQLVQADDGSSSPGDSISANGDGLIPGFVIRWAAGAYTSLEDCWIRPSDLASDDVEATVITVSQKDRFIGRLSGVETSGGSTYPVYLVRVGGMAGVHDIDAFEGGPLTIDSGDTLYFDATDVTWSTERNSVKASRGIVQQVDTDGGDPTLKYVRTAVDKSVCQEGVLTGFRTAGDATLPVENGTRNALTFESTTGSPVDITGTAASGKMAFTAHDPYHTIKDDQGTPNTEDLDYEDTLEFKSDVGDFLVSRASTTTTVTLQGVGAPVGTIWMNWQSPILDTGKYYMDDGAGAADTDWALMDGSSNATPGSGIQICEPTTSGGNKSYFVRGEAKTVADSNDTAHGRMGWTLIDDDEISLTIACHPDHKHSFNHDACADSAGDDLVFGFGGGNPQYTSGMLTCGSPCTFDASLVDHDPVFANNETTNDWEVEMTPPHKKLWFFERVA